MPTEVPATTLAASFHFAEVIGALSIPVIGMVLLGVGLITRSRSEASATAYGSRAISAAFRLEPTVFPNAARLSTAAGANRLPATTCSAGVSDAMAPAIPSSAAAEKARNRIDHRWRNHRWAVSLRCGRQGR